MYDFIKASLIQDHNELLDNPNLEFFGKHSRQTGDIFEYPLEAGVENLKIQIKDNGKYINPANKHKYMIYKNLSGSVHYFWNIIKGNGVHNYNDFSISNFSDLLTILNKDFNLNLFQSKLTRIEYGVNILLPFDARWFLEKCIIAHKFNPPSYRDFNKKGFKIEFYALDEAAI